MGGCGVGATFCCGLGSWARPQPDEIVDEQLLCNRPAGDPAIEGQLQRVEAQHVARPQAESRPTAALSTVDPEALAGTVLAPRLQPDPEFHPVPPSPARSPRRPRT